MPEYLTEEERQDQIETHLALNPHDRIQSREKYEKMKLQQFKELSVKIENERKQVDLEN